MTLLSLKTARAQLDLLPALGGAIGRFDWDGRAVLRPTPAGAEDVLETACFPLVPFCNRIPQGRFEFAGRTVSLAPNLGDHPHVLHGQGWRAPWRVEAAGVDQAVLVYEHPAGEWPWPYSATQIFSLDETGLRVELSVTNTGPSAMPAALGLHPYFAVRPGEQLTAAVDGVWLTDAEILPTTHQAGVWGPDWARGASVATTDLIDHCYTGWNGRATLSAPAGLTTVITASPACRWLHVYAPPGSDFVCAEPVANRPDPFGGPERGVWILEPGEALSVWMAIAVAPAE